MDESKESTSAAIPEALLHDVDDLISRAERAQDSIGLLGHHLGFFCHVCGRLFQKKIKLVRHVRSWSEQQPFPCKHCCESFPTNAALFKHSGIHNVRYVTCTDCGANFKRSADLKNHARTHTGERPFACDECDAAFIQEGTLFIHKRIHDDKKPFPCTDCGAKFRQKTHLEKHELLHKNLKPFACDECPSKFRSNSHLTVHKRVHSGLKPYTCPKCSRTFADGSNFRKHLSKHRV